MVADPTVAPSTVKATERPARSALSVARFSVAESVTEDPWSPEALATVRAAPAVVTVSVAGSVEAPYAASPAKEATTAWAPSAAASGTT